MKDIKQMFKFHAMGLVAASFALASSTSFAGNAVLGTLKAENKVSIVSDSGRLPIENSYSYFNGDKIVTGESASAGLSLFKDGAVYVGEESMVTVEKSDNVYFIQLDRGSVAFSFENSARFQVNVADSIVDSSNHIDKVSGVVTLDANGRVVVKSIDGELTVLSQSGSKAYVNSGESYAAAGHNGELVNVQVTGGGTSTTQIVALGVGGALLINEATDGSSNSANPPAGTTPTPMPTATPTPATPPATTPTAPIATTDDSMMASPSG